MLSHLSNEDGWGHLLEVAQLADGRARVRSYVKSPRSTPSKADQPLGLRKMAGWVRPSGTPDCEVSGGKIWVMRITGCLPYLWEPLEHLQESFPPPLPFVSDSAPLSDYQHIANEKHLYEETKTSLRTQSIRLLLQTSSLCLWEKISFLLNIVENACWKLLS